MVGFFFYKGLLAGIQPNFQQNNEVISIKLESEVVFFILIKDKIYSELDEFLDGMKTRCDHELFNVNGLKGGGDPITLFVGESSDACMCLNVDDSVWFYCRIKSMIW